VGGGWRMQQKGEMGGGRDTQADLLWVWTQTIRTKSSLAWPHDGGEALGSLGTKILGGHKLAPGTTSSSRLCVKVIDQHTNNITPWLRNTQLFPHRLRILGLAPKGLDSSTVAHRLCTRSVHDRSHTLLSNSLYSSAPAFRPYHHWKSSM